MGLLTKHPVDRCTSRYRYWTRKLKECEARFDAFVRSHESDADRKAYAEKANAEYFAIKARLARIKEEYAMARYYSSPLCSDA